MLEKNFLFSCLFVFYSYANMKRTGVKKESSLQSNNNSVPIASPPITSQDKKVSTSAEDNNLSLSSFVQNNQADLIAAGATTAAIGSGLIMKNLLIDSPDKIKQKEVILKKITDNASKEIAEKIKKCIAQKEIFNKDNMFTQEDFLDINSSIPIVLTNEINKLSLQEKKLFKKNELKAFAFDVPVEDGAIDLDCHLDYPPYRNIDNSLKFFYTNYFVNYINKFPEALKIIDTISNNKFSLLNDNEIKKHFINHGPDINYLDEVVFTGETAIDLYNDIINKIKKEQQKGAIPKELDIENTQIPINITYENKKYHIGDLNIPKSLAVKKIASNEKESIYLSSDGKKLKNIVKEKIVNIKKQIENNQTQENEKKKEFIKKHSGDKGIDHEFFNNIAKTSNGAPIIKKIIADDELIIDKI